MINLYSTQKVPTSLTPIWGWFVIWWLTLDTAYLSQNLKAGFRRSGHMKEDPKLKKWVIVGG